MTSLYYMYVSAALLSGFALALRTVSPLPRAFTCLVFSLTFFCSPENGTRCLRGTHAVPRLSCPRYDAFSSILGEGKPFVGIANSYLQSGHTVLLVLVLLCGFVDLPGFPLTSLPYDVRQFLKVCAASDFYRARILDELSLIHI